MTTRMDEPGPLGGTGHGPVSSEYREHLQAVARALDKAFNGDLTGVDRKVGFILLIQKFGDEEDRRTNYISNGTRTDMVAMMKEVLARFEGQPMAEGEA